MKKTRQSTGIKQIWLSMHPGVKLALSLLVLMLLVSQFELVEFRKKQRMEVIYYRCFLLAFPCLGALVLIAKERLVGAMFRSRLTLLLLLFSALCVVSALWSTDLVTTFGWHGGKSWPGPPDTSIETRARNLLYGVSHILGPVLILSVAAASMMIGGKDRPVRTRLQSLTEGFLVLLVVSTTCATVLALLSPDTHFRPYPNTYFPHVRLHAAAHFGGLDHNSIAFIAATLWGLCLNRLVFNVKPGAREKLILCAILANCFFLLFVAISRTAWIIWDVCTIYVLARWLWFFRPRIAMGPLVLLSLFLAFTVTIPINTPVVHYLNRTKMIEGSPSAVIAAGGRTYTWQAAVSVIGDRPILGYGLGGWEQRIGKRGRELFPERKSGKFYHTPHSSYLCVAYYTGSVGLLLWLAVLGYMGQLLARRNLGPGACTLTTDMTVLFIGLILASVTWGAVGYAFHLRSFCLIPLIPFCIAARRMP